MDVRYNQNKTSHQHQKNILAKSCARSDVPLTRSILASTLKKRNYPPLATRGNL
jgi:hypothetical protein